MNLFKKRKFINLSYTKQGLVFFICRNWNILGNTLQNLIIQCCIDAAGETAYKELYRFLRSGIDITEYSFVYDVDHDALKKWVNNFYTSFIVDLTYYFARH